MDRFVGSFKLDDTQALVRALGKASDSQLAFWYQCAKAKGLSHQAGLIRAEINDRRDVDSERIRK